ncbi:MULTISPECIES: GrrA/OscA1 family cyclophane-containing rSAM-modified RiPP [Aphanothece]|uniref:GrrA/OscA1 family cyclophane-containing rSAM-modified RiPP n=1 Tax=Aphanothece TaxID=1121 RepID=UPI003984FD80
MAITPRTSLLLLLLAFAALVPPAAVQAGEAAPRDVEARLERISQALLARFEGGQGAGQGESLLARGFANGGGRSFANGGGRGFANGVNRGFVNGHGYYGGSRGFVNGGGGFVNARPGGGFVNAARPGVGFVNW